MKVIGFLPIITFWHTAVVLDIVGCVQLLTNLLLIVVKSGVVPHPVFRFESVETLVHIAVIVVFIEKPTSWVAWIVCCVPKTKIMFPGNYMYLTGWYLALGRWTNVQQTLLWIYMNIYVHLQLPVSVRKFLEYSKYSLYPSLWKILSLSQYSPLKTVSGSSLHSLCFRR